VTRTRRQLSFGVGYPTRADYCLNHIPRWVRFKMWIKGEW
jgi:hypothetical protein